MSGVDPDREDTAVPETPIPRGSVQPDEERGPMTPFDRVNTTQQAEHQEFEMSIVEQAVCRVSPQSSFSSLTPPDGGWRAWCVCFSGPLIYMNTWGWVNSFGIFQAYYVDKFGRTASDISWIGSVSVFLLFFVGTLTGRLVDAGYFRYVFVTGILLQVVGVMVTSHFFVAQGVLVGFGHSCISCPVLAVLSTYFARRRALAMGIAACGSATGGMVFPSLVRQLLPKLGFTWTLGIAGLTQLLTLSVALVFAKPRIKPRGLNPLVDWSAFKDVEFALYVTASFFTCWGVCLAYYFIAAYSQIALDPPLTYTESLDLLMILNGVGIVGRLASSWVADHTGAINVFTPHALAASILLYFWILVTDKAGLGLMDELTELRALEKTFHGSDTGLGRGIWKAIGYPEFRPYLEADATAVDREQLFRNGLGPMYANTFQYGLHQLKWIREILTPFLQQARVACMSVLVTDKASWTSDVEGPAVSMASEFCHGSQIVRFPSKAHSKSRVVCLLYGPLSSHSPITHCNGH
ncbi:hypothetical protein NW764_015733 [Fusarium oxysporum]|nr:hypothetical protein NW764_015733 [Fusarium oxysporum]